ncbi:MAG: ATP-dependent Clp protease adapter ClpS [Acidithiobacillus sp.]|nr:ATP-dependent Clp protease adapter ClpS [Acidithiobacillus sp.]
MANRKVGQQPVLERQNQLREPHLYRVCLLNDDFTPMDYVVHILERYFHKDHQEATRIMLTVHQEGKGVCGIYPFDLAETKVAMVTADARQHQHPLRCTMEKE